MMQRKRWQSAKATHLVVRCYGKNNIQQQSNINLYISGSLSLNNSSLPEPPS
jgi:hypothetical protein